LALLCVLIAITAVLAPGKISSLELRREAMMAAERIRAQMLKEPDAVFEALTRPGHAPQLANIFDQAGYAHRVLRFELYDEAGQLRFTSGLSGMNLSDFPQAATAGPTAEMPEVALYEAAGRNTAPTDFAVFTLPMQVNGQPHGTLVVYLNQSDQASVLSDYFGIIAAVTLLLLSVGIATPAAFAWMRSQERRQAEEQVRYLENHDALTGLANRHAFIEGLSEAMQRMTRDRTQIAVLYLDIDKFKEINDAADHAGGDQVLREIGARIKLTLRDRDLLARLSGDEFAIALVDITNLSDGLHEPLGRCAAPTVSGRQQRHAAYDECRSGARSSRWRPGDDCAPPCHYCACPRQGRRRPAHVLFRAEHGQGIAAAPHGRARA
jgi:GGDEF domain-containing protein